VTYAVWSISAAHEVRCLIFRQNGATDVLGTFLEEGGTANTVDSVNAGELACLFVRSYLIFFGAVGEGVRGRYFKFGETLDLDDFVSLFPNQSNFTNTLILSNSISAEIG
jgi:hypothetical protein